MFKRNKSSKAESESSLISFVGKVLESEWDTARSGFYAFINVRAELVKQVYSSVEKDTISFIMYGHVVFDKVEVGRYYLFFIEKKETGEYVNLEYLYDDVCQTEDGEWIGPVPQSHIIYSDYKPEELDFARRIRYQRYWYDEDGFSEETEYDSNYYRADGDSIYPIKGFYLKDLFKMYRDGVLTIDGYFDDVQVPRREIIKPVMLDSLSGSS